MRGFNKNWRDISRGDFHRFLESKGRLISSAGRSYQGVEILQCADMGSRSFFQSLRLNSRGQSELSSVSAGSPKECRTSRISVSS